MGSLLSQLPESLPGINEVTGHDGLPVGPSRVRTQIEGPRLLILAGAPLLGYGGNGLERFRVQLRQPFEHRSHDICLGRRRRHRRIEVLWSLPVAPTKFLFSRRRGLRVVRL